jgi:hypothetical protein
MAALPTERRWFRFGLRSLLAGVTICALLFAYVGAYWRLAERGRAVQREGELAGFFYVEIEPGKGYDVFWHRTFALLFFPANQLDHQLLGGSLPCQGGTFGLSEGKASKRTTEQAKP